MRDEERSNEVNVRARVVVNATGIFSDELRRLDDPASRPLLSLSRGSHIVVPHEVFPGKDALLVSKTDDGRVLFIIPWHDHVLIGTTDIAEAQPSLDPVPTQEEIDYLLHHAARYLERPISRSQITATYCGLRPLVDGAAASTARLSREHVVETSISGWSRSPAGNGRPIVRWRKTRSTLPAKSAALQPRRAVRTTCP